MKHLCRIFAAALLVIATGHLQPLRAQEILWEQTAGPVGRTVNALVASEPGHIVAGTDSGVFISSDRGQTWNRTTSGEESPVVHDLAFGDNGLLYAGTDRGLLRSTDYGYSWSSPTQLSGQPEDVNDIALLSDGTLLVGVVVLQSQFGAIFRSTDNGESWSSASSGLIGGDHTLDFALSEEKVYVATDGGGIIGYNVLYLWDDEEQEWRLSGTVPPQLQVTALVLREEGELFVGTSIGVLRSTDGGATWQSAGLWPLAVRTLTEGSNGTLYASTTHPIPGESLYRSTDNGTTWFEFSSGLNGTAVLSLCIGSDSHLYAGTLESGVYRTSGSISDVDVDTDRIVPERLELW